MQIIFQDPASSLDPREVLSASLIAEPLKVHEALQEARPELEKRVAELMDTVGLARASDAFSYPHELDGGRRQRIGIARALSVDPRGSSSAMSLFPRWMYPFRHRF